MARAGMSMTPPLFRATLDNSCACARLGSASEIVTIATASHRRTGCFCTAARPAGETRGPYEHADDDGNCAPDRCDSRAVRSAGLCRRLSRAAAAGWHARSARRVDQRNRHAGRALARAGRATGIHRTGSGCDQQGGDCGSRGRRGAERSRQENRSDPVVAAGRQLQPVLDRPRHDGRAHRRRVSDLDDHRAGERSHSAAHRRRAAAHRRARSAQSATTVRKDARSASAVCCRSVRLPGRRCCRSCTTATTRSCSRRAT